MQGTFVLKVGLSEESGKLRRRELESAVLHLHDGGVTLLNEAAFA